LASCLTLLGKNEHNRETPVSTGFGCFYADHNGVPELGTVFLHRERPYRNSSGAEGWGTVSASLADISGVYDGVTDPGTAVESLRRYLAVTTPLQTSEFCRRVSATVCDLIMAVKAENV